MGLLSRLKASLDRFVKDQSAQADAFFWVSIGLGLSGRADLATWALAFTACLYLRHLCGKLSGGN